MPWGALTWANQLLDHIASPWTKKLEEFVPVQRDFSRDEDKVEMLAMLLKDTLIIVVQEIVSSELLGFPLLVYGLAAELCRGACLALHSVNALPG